MVHFVYILYSVSADKYYIGSCSNIDVRLSRHNAGATISTKSGRPWKVVYSEEFNSKSEAIKREYHLKRMKSRVFIESLINKSSPSKSVPIFIGKVAGSCPLSLL